MAQEPPPSRFRALTTSLGFLHPATSRSSSDHSSTQSFPPSRAQTLFGNFTLFLRVHSAQHLPAVTQSSYCKLYLGETPIVGGFGQGKSLVGADRRLGSSHQTFHTKVQSSAHKDNPEWNEKFQLSVRNPNTEVLTIRVKSHVLLYSPAVGACVVHLRQLQLGVTVDEWFPLVKNDKPAGQIRLQMSLQENLPTPAPERRYSQPSEEMIQRLMQENRQLEEAKRREVELQQEQKWKQMEQDAIKRVGLDEQKEREETWRQQLKEREAEQHQSRSEDSDMLPSFKYRGVKTEQAQATQLMEQLSLQAGIEEDKAKEKRDTEVSSGYTINRVDSRVNAADFADVTTGFGTIRMSVEEMEQVAQNALPTSDSSESTSSERRRRKDRNNKKLSSRRKKHHRRRTYSDDECSDDSEASWGDYRKGSSRLKIPDEEVAKKKSTDESVSSRIDAKIGNQDSEIPITLSFPPSPSDESSSSFSSEEERRQRRRRRAKRREKERRRRSKRKLAKSRDYDSSDSSSLSQSADSSSSLSSSEEERLRRKLKKKMRAKKAKARAKLAESGGSRASTRTLGMRKGSTDARDIDHSPPVAQRWGPRGADSSQADPSQQGGRYARTTVQDPAASTMPTSSFDSSSAQHQQLYGSKADIAYGPDGVGFDEPGQPATQQYLGQTTKEQTNAALMRSFCF